MSSNERDTPELAHIVDDIGSQRVNVMTEEDSSIATSDSFLSSSSPGNNQQVRGWSIGISQPLTW